VWHVARSHPFRRAVRLISLECLVIRTSAQSSPQGGIAMADKKTTEKKKSSSHDKPMQGKKTAEIELSEEDLKKVTGAATTKKSHY
jgi:hypothetical protein